MNSQQPKQHPIGFIEALPKPSEEELAHHYQNMYYQELKGGYSNIYNVDELAYFSNVASVANRVAEKMGLTHTMADFGCGEGYFAKAFLNFGWLVDCFDYSAFGIRKHNPELLPNFLKGDSSEAIKHLQSIDKRFGLINLQNVLEHVLDPIGLLNDLKGVLGHTQSAVRIKVPNDYSDFQTELVERGSTTNTWFSPPEHLSYFNKESLVGLLHHCGYRIHSLQADFPIEIFLANPHSNYWRNRDLGKGAHSTRVFVENFLIQKNLDDYINYSEAAGKLGFGRELIAYAILV